MVRVCARAWVVRHRAGRQEPAAMMNPPRPSFSLPSVLAVLLPWALPARAGTRQGPVHATCSDAAALSVQTTQLAADGRLQVTAATQTASAQTVRLALCAPALVWRVLPAS